MNSNGRFLAGNPSTCNRRCWFHWSHLVDKLVTFGVKVRVADNFSRGLLLNLSNCKSELEVRNVDLTDLHAYIDACRDVDVVLALAARVSGIQFNQTNSGEMFRINSRVT